MDNNLKIRKTKQGIRDYFHNLYLHHDCCTNETFDALVEFFKYILLKNNLNPDDYIMTLHLVKELEDDTVAMMSQDDKDPNKFDVYLPIKKLRVHNLNEISNVFLTFIDAGHEFEHIVQYIQEQKIINDYDRCITNLDSNMIYVLNQDAGKPKRYKHVENLFNRYETELGKISTIEMKADLKSYEYLFGILIDIMNNDKDLTFTDFICQCYEHLKKDFKRRKRMIYECHQAHEQTLEILKKRFKISESLMPLP